MPNHLSERAVIQSTARDLAIARAVSDTAIRTWITKKTKLIVAAVSDKDLLAIIAAVDASLGGKAGDSHAPAPVLDRAAEDHGTVAAPTGGVHPESRSAQAAEPPGDDIVWPDTKIVTTVNPYANGYREAKREAVGIIRELVDGTASEAVFVAALQYIAAAEADAAEPAKPVEEGK
jgi:membrane-associated protease RseP (regulator of RpoE activity)